MGSADWCVRSSASQGAEKRLDSAYLTQLPTSIKFVANPEVGI